MISSHKKLTRQIEKEKLKTNFDGFEATIWNTLFRSQNCRIIIFSRKDPFCVSGCNSKAIATASTTVFYDK